MKNIGMKLTSLTAIAGMVFAISPIAYAGTIRIINNNTADISNAVSTSAVSGGNVSSGEGGGMGGDAGSLTLDNTNSLLTGDRRSGDGGRGGNGGNGGTIMTGEAIATTMIENNINTTETHVEDVLDENCSEESLDAISEVGNSEDTTYDTASSKTKSASDSSTLSTLDNSEDALSETFDAESDSSASEEGEAAASASSSSSESSSDSATTSEAAATFESSETSSESSAGAVSESSSESATTDSTNSDTSTVDDAADSTLEVAKAFTESASSSKEEHDNHELHYRCVRSGDLNNIEVENTNTGSADNAVSGLAISGDNVSEAGLAATGGVGGSLTLTGDSNEVDGADTAGMGGIGGNGGNGGNVTAGRADSLSDIVNTSGRTITRVVRN
jgi:hypothetical protein